MRFNQPTGLNQYSIGGLQVKKAALTTEFQQWGSQRGEWLLWNMRTWKGQGKASCKDRRDRMENLKREMC